jgi:hypothetical protein
LKSIKVFDAESAVVSEKYESARALRNAERWLEHHRGV